MMILYLCTKVKDMIEIERKFLVNDSSYKEMASTKIHIIQGYLNREPLCTVRVRVAGNRGLITIKGISKGISRHEYEYEIPVDDAKEMMKLCERGIVEKIRHIVEYGGLRWEIDEFRGGLAPLTVAEVEIPSHDTEVTLPPFIGEEVSGNPYYYNSSLSEMAATCASGGI